MADVVNLRVGDEHELRLKGLATAGYRWVPAVEDGAVADVFTIRAVGPGATRVRFEQRRPFGPKDVPPAEEHVVEIRVT